MPILPFLVEHALSVRDDSNQTSTTHHKNLYGYTPTFWICELFVVLFAVSTLVHFVQALGYRRYFFLLTVVLGGCIEILGWAARTWSSQDVTNSLPFKLQLVATILAPTPILAADFVILEKLILRLGESYSRLSPKLYTKIFFSCDLISLVVQGAGGAIASSELSAGKSISLGSNVMLGGIVFQLCVMTIYLVLGTEFSLRYSRNRPIRGKGKTSNKQRVHRPLDSKLSWFVAALVFNTGCLYIRSIYRTIELADGFDGEVIHTQWLFNTFDALMVILAMAVFNFIHLGQFFVDETPTSEGLVYSPLKLNQVDWARS